MTYQRARPLPHRLDPVALSTGGAVRLGATRWPWLRRLCFVLPVIASTGAGTWLAIGLTAGAGPLRPVLLVLLVANLLFLAVTGWPGVLGIVLRLTCHRTPIAACTNGTSRTAVLFPIYNEDAHAVFTAAEIMAQALIEHSVDRTDIFVLSDTRDSAIALAEEQAFDRLSPLFGERLRYRRRVQNVRRKAGNIAEFCKTWSGEYDYMVVLDADSLMSAASITTLIGLMDANPSAGLMQTVPYAVGRETLFARIQQFAARLYTPLLVEGLAFWQGEDGNYWGHNAIIRIAPFMAHCELPILPGREPFGGEILCHDVVEAAMMRRAGWQVWLLPSLAESYEALPANLVDFAQRERRWCQGNLQHLGVLGMPGLRPVGRYHLALGVLSYLSGPLFILFAGLATLDGALGGGFIARLLGSPGPARAGFVGLTFFLLYGAKLCSLAAALAHEDTAASFGGRLRLLASAVLEQALAMVSAPILLVFYTRFIGMMLLGRAVQWDAQPRDDRGVAWGEAAQRMRLPMIVGVVWLAGASMAGGTPLHWALSLVPGLLLAMPASVWTSVASFGLLARRWGLFLTEDEVAPSPILRAFNRALVRDTVPLAHTMPHPQFGYLHPSESEAH
jgi:membrane glycosyltransferase